MKSWLGCGLSKEGDPASSLLPSILCLPIQVELKDFNRIMFLLIHLSTYFMFWHWKTSQFNGNSEEAVCTVNREIFLFFVESN